MSKYSVIIPIYNRPNELDELLGSLCLQTFADFEVIIVEDGSTLISEKIYEKYKSKLRISYFYKINEGQGFGRNFGSKYATGKYLVFFDSDVVVPKSYFEIVNDFINKHDLDAYGGEDRASEDFSPFQKALSYSMTSFLTTGGIRNKNNNVGGNYQIRSYNCGIKSSVFNEIGGFKKTNMGEDMELNNRLEKNQANKTMIPGAFVYHKRRGNFKSFFQQIISFGQTRVQLKKNFNIPIKLVHLFPLGFVLFTITSLALTTLSGGLSKVPLYTLLTYLGLILVHSTMKNKSIKVGLLSVIASFTQHWAYGLGFLKELLSGK